MKTRLTADHAREIAANAPVKKTTQKSQLWEKNKWKIFQAALDGSTTYVICGRDEVFLRKVTKLGFQAVEEFRNHAFEQSKAEFELRFQEMEAERQVMFEELESVILKDRKVVSKWPELCHFLDGVDARSDEYWEDDMTADEETNESIRWEMDINEDEEIYTYDYDAAFLKFTENVSSYPADIAKSIRKLIAAEDEYYPAKFKSEKYDGIYDWELDDVSDEQEREYFNYVCHLPTGRDYGYVIDWKIKSDDWNHTQFTGQINAELLSWISSKSGQIAISEVELEVKSLSNRKKTECVIPIKIGKEENDRYVEFAFPSFDAFKVIFEFLGFAVLLKRNLEKKQSESNIEKVSLSWGT